MTLASGPRFCIACGEAPRTSYRLRNGADLLRCPTCRLGWWNWPTFDPQQFYDVTYFQSPGVSRGYDDYAALEPAARITARARLGRVARLLGTTSTSPRLLDLGCGTGVFLEEAQRLGWRGAGQEVSPYASSVAQGRGLNVTCGPVDGAALPQGPFDVVTLWDVIEHLRDPRATLQAAAAVLSVGGVLALSTGDIESWAAKLTRSRWHLFNLPEHLYFFSKAALRRMLDDCGCSIRACGYEVNWAPVSYLVERLQKSLRLPRFVAAPRRAAHWVAPATLWDVLGVYAVKLR